jgi:hypothetical protein
MTRTKTETALERQVAEKSTAMLECRTWQHPWDVNRGDVVSDGANLLWSVPCSRCTTVKTKKLNRRTGRTAGGASYVYPDGYLFHDVGALGAVELGELRMVLLKRMGSL